MVDQVSNLKFVKDAIPVRPEEGFEWSGDLWTKSSPILNWQECMEYCFKRSSAPQTLEQAVEWRFGPGHSDFSSNLQYTRTLMGYTFSKEGQVQAHVIDCTQEDLKRVIGLLVENKIKNSDDEFHIPKYLKFEKENEVYKRVVELADSTDRSCTLKVCKVKHDNGWTQEFLSDNYFDYEKRVSVEPPAEFKRYIEGLLHVLMPGKNYTFDYLLAKDKKFHLYPIQTSNPERFFDIHYGFPRDCMALFPVSLCGSGNYSGPYRKDYGGIKTWDSFNGGGVTRGVIKKEVFV